MNNNSNITKIAYALIGPILSLIAFIITYFIDPLNFGGQQPMAAVPAFLLSVVILIINQNINTNIEIRKASIYSGRIYEAIKDYLHVTKLGSPENAVSYINSRMPSLREAKNTTFNTVQALDRAEEKFYETDSYLDTMQLIAMHCSKKLIWKDIGDAFAIDRCRDIAITSQNLAKGSKSRYKYKLITHQEPQMNFIILEYTDGEKEVLFNWDFRGIGQDPTVLLSRDKQIIDMFSIHYEHLWRSANVDHDIIPTK